MKKVISAVLAGAMMATMAVPAFAANIVQGNVYDSDGEIISKSGDDVYGDVDYDYVKNGGDVKIDGVVPGITMYIPLGSDMGYCVGGKKLSEYDFFTAEANTKAKEEDPQTYKIVKVTDPKDATYYAAKDDKVAEKADATQTEFEKLKSIEDLELISLDSLTNEDYFKFDVDKDDNGSMVKKIEVVEDKKLGDLTRSSYLKVTLNDSSTTSDIKSNGTVSFKAKGASEDFDTASGSKKLTKDDFWPDDLEIKMDYTFWINNSKMKNDDNPDSGDRVYFDPDDNEDNTLIWGDDRAGLYFEANDDANKFYARLQTKTDSEIYATYGDPADADLWFFDFVGNPTVPSTARATLTLGIPWDDDDDYTPNPEDCFVYEEQADGTLKDVTSQFTYDEDNDGTTDIEGWTIKTRTLGTYIISDTELDLDVDSIDMDEEPVDDTTSAVVDNTGKEIPNTGSSDMVGVAMVAAVVSLAAAGAVAFKKASK